MTQTISFPGGLDGKESACNAGDLGLIPWRREWLPSLVFLPGKFHGLEKPGHEVAKNWTQLNG